MLNLINGQSAAYQKEEIFMGLKKLSLEELNKRIADRFPEEKFEITEYNGATDKPATIKCCTCGQNIQVSKFLNFLAPNKAYGCKNCHGLWKEREKFLEEVKKYWNITGTHVHGTHTYYHITCKECGHKKESTLGNLKCHLRCGCETNNKPGRTGEEFLKEANSYISEGEYALVGKYVNQITPVLLRHSCGFIWKARPADYLRGRSFCPQCGRKQSKGERYIENFLKEKNIPYEKEKELNDGRKKHQRFDFYLENDNHKIAIEFDGEQHFKETNFFKASLLEIQENDNRKNEYCKENNIQIFRLPYTLLKNTEEFNKQLCSIVDKFNDYPEKEYIISKR